MPFIDTGLTDAVLVALSALGLGALVGVGEVVQRSGWLTAEGSRRLIHAGTGVFAALTPLFFAAPQPVMLLAAVFVLVNGVAWRRRWFAGMHGVTRASSGTVTFPLALLVAVVAFWWLDPSRRFSIVAAFLLLAVADPLAAVIGTQLRRPGRFAMGTHTRSVAGVATFFLLAAGMSVAVLGGFYTAGIVPWPVETLLGVALCVATVTAAAEALGGGGWDNLFVPLAACLVFTLFLEAPAGHAHLYGAVLAGLAFGGASYALRFLDRSGAVAGGLLAATLIGVGGLAWAVPAFTFFVLSSLLSKLGRRRKAAAAAGDEKGSVRDAGQVYANGGVGWLLLACYAVYPADALYWGFVGAFAAAAADTWGTEIGTLLGGTPRDIVTLRRVPTGTSGGVSVGGTLGAFAGAASVWVAAALAGGAFVAGVGGRFSLAVLGGGVLGSLADSLAGATVQARYRDAATGFETERAATAGRANRLLRGRSWINNDRVNVLCTLVGALAALLLAP